MSQTKKLERLVRGFANHRRIQIIELLNKEPELSVSDISRTLGVNYKTVAEHVRRLAIAGLVMKRNEGPAVRHALTKQGGLFSCSREHENNKQRFLKSITFYAE